MSDQEHFDDREQARIVDDAMTAYHIEHGIARDGYCNGCGHLIGEDDFDEPCGCDVIS